MEQSQRPIRRSRVREAILSLLQREQAPVSASEMRQYLKNERISANKTTVYRAIAHFESEGVIHVVRLDERESRYELASLGHHHHAVCVECRKVEEIEAREGGCPEGVCIPTKSGPFKVLDHTLEIFGLCRKCQIR